MKKTGQKNTTFCPVFEWHLSLVCELPLGSSTIGPTVGTILSFQFALKPENSRFECVGGTEGER